MGLHQDRVERSPAPVVSLSLGDTGLFRLGNTPRYGVEGGRAITP
ncbi:hypothetical protein Arub01_19780 [Actinomadura rubrobrunea]|uniref:Alpha-ketoglutarate-dependent dioxygenase AlkB-like domain-containing protein n=1 Tax=Actinomadura rubrobrunea TaxID=115335 RepID=A0A9W6PSH5_9ACTN|nr:hypothetical protein Arub01_19780 [Actinomadura rubrobrunea]